MATEKLDGPDSTTVRLTPLTEIDPLPTVIFSDSSYSKLKYQLPFSSEISVHFAI